MRKSIIDSLTNVRVTNLDNFALISSALQEVSASEDEVAEISQVCIGKKLDTGSRVRAWLLTVFLIVAAVSLHPLVILHYRESDMYSFFRFRPRSHDAGTS